MVSQLEDRGLEFGLTPQSLSRFICEIGFKNYFEPLVKGKHREEKSIGVCEVPKSHWPRIGTNGLPHSKRRDDEDDIDVLG